MMIHKTIAAFFLLCLAACGPVTPAPVPTPLPTLEPAGTFIAGLAEVPPGSYLLVTIHPGHTCSAECTCPVVEPPVQAYSLDGDLLSIRLLEGLYLEAGWQVRQLDPQPLGFLGHGEYNEHMTAIPGLPFTSPDGFVTIHSVEADGTIVARVGDETYRMIPGQSWQSSNTVEQENPPGCRITYTYAFVHRGLWQADRISGR